VGSSWQVGDTLGIYVDQEKDQVVFYVNSLKKAEGRLPVGTSDKRLYPVVFSSTSGDKFEMQPYAIKPDSS